jgi:FKBP-type peptidyl-prolyl cis-trans isomerase
MHLRSLALVFVCALGGCSDCGEPAAPAKVRAAVQTAKTSDGAPPPDDLRLPPASAERLPSGLISRVLAPGRGGRPMPQDVVRLHYTGWTMDGAVFHDTRRRGQPAEVPLDQAIPGWIEGIQRMQEGEKRRFWIPVQLAYQGRPGFPQGNLVFDVELLRVEQRSPPTPVPGDLAAAPASATRSESGLASLVLKKGHGKLRPGLNDVVTVQYDGWLADGTPFDSTYRRGGPATVPLNRVIPGWQEGIAQMVVGEKRRLWVPSTLAYLGREGPQGQLVYDLELVDIQVGKAPPLPKPKELPRVPEEPMSSPP